MGETMHVLIVGPKGSGKSTLIRRLVQALGKPVWGYETRKEERVVDPQRGSPISLTEWGSTADPILVGYCKNRHAQALPEGFDRFAPRLSQPPQGHLVVLDEIGFLESASPAFCQGILHLLDGDQPVLAAVRDKSGPFLDQVRSHPNVRCFPLTSENREALLEDILAYWKEAAL